MGLLSLSRCETAASKSILAAAETLGRHAFNPSVRAHGVDIVVAARVSDAATGPVRASFATIGSSRTDPTPDRVQDLTRIGAVNGIEPVADPKLFSYRGAVWATFNTGYVASGNAIYIMQVFPEVGRPVRCEAPDRQIIEKNWGFFEGPDGELRAIYLLNPLTVLSFGVLSKESDTKVVVGRVVSRLPNESCAGLTIGTQPVEFDGSLMLIAHERVGARRWRGYFGRVVRFDRRVGRGIVGRPRLIHDRRTMLGTSPRRNKHLWFATYFSGLELIDGVPTVTYGINDQRSGAAALPPHAL